MRIASIFLCGVLLAPVLIHAADPPLDFSGDWVVSDNNDDASPSAKPSAGNGSNSRGGGHGMGGGHHGGRGNRSTNNSNGSTSSDSFASAVPREHAHALIVRQSDDVFDIEANGRRMAYRFDNKHNYGPQYGGTVTLTWAAPEIVIETHPDGGGEVEEHYRLSDDGKKLTLILRTQPSGGDTKETRRVYVRRDADAQ